MAKRYLAKIDSLCIECGSFTYMGITPMVFIESTHQHMCENCFDLRSEEPQCIALTKNKARCKLPAKDSRFCSSHSLDYQCNAVRRDGSRCKSVTGGGRCQYHPNGKYKDYSISKADLPETIYS